MLAQFTSIAARGARAAALARHAPAMSISAGERPFRVLGLQQIAIGGLDKAPLSHLWSNLLGVPKIGDYKAEKENVDEDILKLGKGPFAVEIDLMQPIDPEKAPKVHVPTLNHIGLWVDDIQAAVTELGEKGVRSYAAAARLASLRVLRRAPSRPPLSPASCAAAAAATVPAPQVRFAPGGIRPGAAGHDVTFLHPKGNADLPYSGEGVLIELVQAPEDVIAVE